VKRRDLTRHLEANGCELLREGGRHSVYVNRRTRKARRCRDTVRSTSTSRARSVAISRCRLQPPNGLAVQLRGTAATEARCAAASAARSLPCPARHAAARQLQPLVGRRARYPPISGTERFRQIFRASRFAISVCLGTASTAPVAGLHQRECDAPSRLRKHPWRRRCRSSAPRFTRR
jgi:hypothetical protein